MVFAHKVVRVHADKIDFSAFNAILSNIELAIDDHAKKKICRYHESVAFRAHYGAHTVIAGTSALSPITIPALERARVRAT